jgi:hypothetical protein
LNLFISKIVNSRSSPFEFLIIDSKCDKLSGKTSLTLRIKLKAGMNFGSEESLLLAGSTFTI